MLGEIAPDADQYYIHDLAILPEVRGQGGANECMEKVLSVAEGFETICLVSVYGTASFWRRFGFVPVVVDEALKAKLRGYGDGARYLERKNPWAMEAS